MNVWIILILCLTICCCVSEIADIFKEKYKKESEEKL